MNLSIVLFLMLLQGNDSTNVHILPSINISSFIEEATSDKLIINFEGLPINPSFIQIVSIGNRKYISLPILINDINLEPKVESNLFDPKYWKDIENAMKFGRPSLWHLPTGVKTIYCILIDPRSEYDIGVGLVFVENTGNDIYEVFLTDLYGVTLFAAGGLFIRKDSTLGIGYIRPFEIEPQKIIHNKYNPLWNINPSEFFLFGQ